MEKSCTNCGKPVKRYYTAWRWCRTCFGRWQRNGDPNIVHLIRDHPPTCSICDEPYKGQGYCGKHLRRFRKHGDPLIVLPPSKPPLHRKYVVNEEYFSKIATGEQAYWLGFITADGSISSSRWPSLRIELKDSDEGHLLKFARAVGTDAPTRKTGQRCVAISVSSPRLVKDLADLGVTSRKSLVVEPPLDRLVGVEPYYWRGLWDGDGTIHKKSRDRGGWDIGCVGSFACIDGFGVWAREISGSKARPNNKSSKNPDFWQWHLGGTTKAQLLAEQLRLAGIGFGLDRKQALLDELCAFDFAEHRAQVRARLRVQLRAAHSGWLARKKEAAETGLLPLWD